MRARGFCRRLAVIGAVGVVAVLAAGEAAAQGQVPSAGTCTNYSLSKTAEEFTAAGGSDSFTVSWTWTPPATPNCVVHCSPNVCSRILSPSWITDVTLRSGTVSYKVSKNPSELARSGDIVVGFSAFTVNQEGLECPGAPLASGSKGAGTRGGNVTVTGTADPDCGPYTVSENESWLSTNVSSIKGNRSVVISARPNSGAKRSGTVSIGTAEITINQCGTSPDSVSPTTHRTRRGGGETFDITVGGWSHCSWRVSDNKDWLSAGALDKGKVRVTVGRNASDAELSGTVTIGGSSVTVIVPPPCPSSLTSVDPTSKEMPADGGSFEVMTDGPSDCPFSASSNESWMSVSPSSFSGGAKVRVTVQRNPTDSAARSGKVTIGGKEVTVNQVAGCPTSLDSVSPASKTVSDKATSFSVSTRGRSDCSLYTASSNASWLTVDSSSGISGGDSVTITVKKHTGTSERSGTVTIGGRGVAVTQTPPCPSSLDSVDPTSRTVGAGAGSFDVTTAGRSDCTFSASSGASWLSVSPSSFSGGATVRVTAQGNSGAKRSGSLSIGGHTVNVTQRAKVEPCGSSPDSVSPTSRTSAAAGEDFDVTVEGRSDCSWTVSDDQDWLSTSVSNVSGGGKVTVTVASNSGGSRSGSVSIGGLSVTVNQAAAGCPAAPGLTPAMVTFGADGTGAGGVAVSGSSHCDYDVTVSSGSTWLSTDIASVAGGGTVTLSAATNTGAERTGTVTVGTSTVSVTQSAAGCPAPGLTPAMVTFGADGTGAGGVAVSGSGHCGYTVTVTGGSTWLSADVARVSGSGTVTLSAAANTGAERTGTVTVGTATVSVTQSAAACPEAPGLTPAMVTFGADGTGAGGVAVSGSGHCGYAVTVTSGSTWLSTDIASVNGGGTVTLSATANTGIARTGTVSVGTGTVSVTQSATACPAAPGLTPGTVSFGADGTGDGAVAVSGSVHCGYAVTVTGGSTWLSTDTASVNGGGTVTLSATANTEAAARMGTVTVGASIVSVTQSPRACTSTGLAPAAVVFEADGSGNGTVAVSGSERCGHGVRVPRSASSWLSADAAHASSGGTLTLSARANPGGERMATVTVGRATLTVTQWGATCPPAPGVTPDIVKHGRRGGSTTVAVRGSSRCQYAVSAGEAWVTADPPQVTGGGTVTVTVKQRRRGRPPRRGAVAVGEAGVRVAQGNTKPVAAGDAVTVWREIQTPVAVLENDTDADADPLKVMSVGRASNGTAAVTADGERVTYTSLPGWHGVDRFTYEVADDFGGTAQGTVTVTVRSATPFTDPVLTAGAAPIRAVHMTELRTRANAVRGECGLSAATWTDPVLTVGVTPVKAAHMTELREAVTAAYTACGETLPTWTDAVLTAGVTPIRASHMLELREAVIALED